jgi:hypothetical protein
MQTHVHTDISTDLASRTREKMTENLVRLAARRVETLDYGLRLRP